MNKRLILRRLTTFYFFFFPLLLGAYSVTFTGIDQEIETTLKKFSPLVQLQNRPPSSNAALKRRVNADLPILKNTLQNLGFYSAEITTSIDDQQVTFTILLGEKFTFSSFSVIGSPISHMDTLKKFQNRTALNTRIFEVENQILQELINEGYPSAVLVERKVLGDRSTHSIQVIYQVSPGTLGTFGPLKIEGLSRVKLSFLLNKICWREGERFSPRKIDQTRKMIEESGLFSTVTIKQGEDGDSLPITIEVEEGTYRTFGLGLSYSTQRGAGGGLEWVNQNFSGKGDRLGVVSYFLQKEQEVSFFYAIPHFLQSNQTANFSIDWVEEKTKGYDERAITLKSLFDVQLSPTTSLFYGGEYKHTRVTQSNENGSFNILNFPIGWREFTACDALNPQPGRLIEFSLKPSFSLSSPAFSYSTTSIQAARYTPIASKAILATRVFVESILGADKVLIPPSERLYAGSEQTLRGYAYQTVSPIVAGKPDGGRSLFIANCELRGRLSEEWGGIVFFDIGNVYETPYPKMNKKMLKSVGAGIRYFTQVGPIRIDVGFPLNRRPAFDARMEFYISIGQTF